MYLVMMDDETMLTLSSHQTLNVTRNLYVAFTCHRPHNFMGKKPTKGMAIMKVLVKDLE